MIASSKIIDLQEILFNKKQKSLEVSPLLGDKVKYEHFSDNEFLKSIESKKITSINSTLSNTPHLPQEEKKNDKDQIKAEEINKMDLYSAKSNLEIIPEPSNAIEKVKIIEEVIEEKVLMKQYTFQSLSDPYIKLPPNYSTDEEYEKKIIDIFNSGYNGWSKVSSDKGTDVYKNDDPACTIMMVKTHVTINYSKDVIFEALENKAIRAQWDPIFNNVTVVETFPETNQEIVYVIIKSKMPFSSDRDMVQLKTAMKNFPNDNCILGYVRSIEHPKHPIISKYVRAKMHIAGYYIEEIEPNKCKVATCNQLDIGLGAMLMSKIAPKSVLNWVENVQKGCKLVLGKK